MVWEIAVQSQVESYQRLKKMVLDAALLSTQHYVRIKGKVEQSWELSCALPNTSAIEKESLRVSLSTMVANFTLLIYFPLSSLLPSK